MVPGYTAEKESGDSVLNLVSGTSIFGYDHQSSRTGKDFKGHLVQLPHVTDKETEVQI